MPATETASDPKATSTNHRVALYKKLHAVMVAIPHIQKDKTNSFHQYNYASEHAIKTAVREQFVKQGLLLTVSSYTEEDSKITYSSPDSKESNSICVNLHWTITDIETGESISGRAVGIGEDKGDKAVYKAITGALKYMLTSQFLIPTGDDPEDDAKGGAVRQPQPYEYSKQEIDEIFSAADGTTSHHVGMVVNGLTLAKSGPNAANPNREYWKYGTEFHSWYDVNPEADPDKKIQKRT